ncbi:Uncharacterized protein dnm_059790 [Desulfonema magnum]|uniref:Uncharacterized protein n=1 Tax=Desulfonema magnum TaxID=45655 RepID=A0A975BRV3_9BACT|nr:Uncharacterized protein dnm_059790 [Desulfonema magnum]
MAHTTICYMSNSIGVIEQNMAVAANLLRLRRQFFYRNPGCQ